MTLREDCRKFNGKVVDGKCKIDGFTMDNPVSLFDFAPQTQQHKRMSPDDFLKSASSFEPFPKRIEELKKKIKSGQPIDPLFFDVDVDSCKVLGHEGRHRAYASRELGIKELPVIIFNKEFDPDAKGMFGVRGLHLKTDRKNKCQSFVQENS